MGYEITWAAKIETVINGTKIAVGFYEEDPDLVFACMEQVGNGTWIHLPRKNPNGSNQLISPLWELSTMFAQMIDFPDGAKANVTLPQAWEAFNDGLISRFVGRINEMLDQRFQGAAPGPTPGTGDPARDGLYAALAGYQFVNGRFTKK